MEKNNIIRHWPTALLGTLVGVILLVAVFSYQVNQNELAVVTTLGKIEDYTPEPGLHFRWPYPIQQIYKFDGRDRTYSGQAGQIEETTTADIQNVLAGIFVVYRIDDARSFYSAFKTLSVAESTMNDWMRGSKKAIFGQYSTQVMINADPKMLKLSEICAKIKDELAGKTAGSGIEIKLVGINTLNVTPGVTTKVFERMAQERMTAATEFTATGRREAEQIRQSANAESASRLATAQAEARRIQAEGDAEAAKYYQAFSKNPELAAFLHKLQAAKEIARQNSTLIFDDKTAPFDIFRPDALQLAPVKQ